MIACWCSTWSWKRLPDSSGWSGRLWGCKPPSSCIPWETLLSLRTKREQAGFTHCPEWEKAALRRMDSIRSQHMTTKGTEKKVKFISIALTVSHLSERQSLNCSRLFYFIYFFLWLRIIRSLLSFSALQCSVPRKEAPSLKIGTRAKISPLFGLSFGILSTTPIRNKESMRELSLAIGRKKREMVPCA